MFVHKEQTKSPYDLLQTTNPAKSRPCTKRQRNCIPSQMAKKKHIHLRKNKTAHENSVHTISLLSIMHSKMSFRVILC